jgi:hypothetical protein
LNTVCATTSSEGSDVDDDDDVVDDDDDDDDDDDVGKVLKERRSPRERDRMGTSVDDDGISSPRELSPSPSPRAAAAADADADADTARRRPADDASRAALASEARRSMRAAGSVGEGGVTRDERKRRESLPSSASSQRSTG